MDLVIGGQYQHYKGNIYVVIGCAKHSETLEELVIYHSLNDKTSMWARPKAMFLDRVIIDGKEQDRFSYIPT